MVMLEVLGPDSRYYMVNINVEIKPGMAHTARAIDIGEYEKKKAKMMNLMAKQIWTFSKHLYVLVNFIFIQLHFFL